MCVEKEVKNHLPCAGGSRGYVEGVVHGAVVVLFDMWTKIRIFYKSQVKRDIFFDLFYSLRILFMSLRPVPLHKLVPYASIGMHSLPRQP